MSVVRIGNVVEYAGEQYVVIGFLSSDRPIAMLASDLISGMPVPVAALSVVGDVPRKEVKRRRRRYTKVLPLSLRGRRAV